MRYIIERLDQGRGFVARPGSLRSYTQNPLEARVFTTHEAAERERCENEQVVSLDELIGRAR